MKTPNTSQNDTISILAVPIGWSPLFPDKMKQILREVLGHFVVLQKLALLAVLKLQGL